ncbi:hypothetical protein Q9L58_010347 [Maublancomyces gigas]|uniref:Uncharacterized protein n=1 Tax=Discina gigas TaxID=1032678 RepID=A0ABR3G4C5_9PEZI
MSDWTPRANHGEFRPQYNQNSQTLYNNISSTIGHLRKERPDIHAQNQARDTALGEAIAEMRAHQSTIDNLNRCITLLQTLHDPRHPPAAKTTKVADPEAFSGSDRPNLPAFFKGLGLKFSVNASKFPNDYVMISYVGALLKGSARECFHPQIDDDGSHSVDNYGAFVLALKNGLGIQIPRQLQKES